MLSHDAAATTKRWWAPGLLPASATPEAGLLLASRALRAFGDGLVSLLLPAYLAALGHGPFEIGLIATATLAGSSVLTLLVGLQAHRLSGRGLLLGASVLMALTGVAFTLAEGFWPLLLIALVGTLNPSAGDVSLFLPLEQARLAHSIADRDRTALFARYSLVGSLAGAVGALCAGFPRRCWAASSPAGQRRRSRPPSCSTPGLGSPPCSFTAACRQRLLVLLLRSRSRCGNPAASS
jgi:MFS family permease